MDDEQAIRKLQQGDIDALEPLVRRYQQRALRAAFLITRDQELAEDVVQTAFLRAFERIDQLKSPSSFGPWLLRSVVNDATKAVSRQRHVPFPANDSGASETDPGLSPLELVEGVETSDELWDALGTLPPAQRAAIVQRYYLGLSEAEIAEQLAAPVGTVKWRLHAARKHMQRTLGSRSGSEPTQPTKEQSSQ